LLAIDESEVLRAQVMELYRSAYRDREGLEDLLAESGLGGGRPARRALRTLDVCLALSEGDYLAARHEDAARRIESIDTSSWQFIITDGQISETLGAVHLADRFYRASMSEFKVARRFAPDELAGRLWDDPAPIAIDICRQHDNHISSDRLEAILVPQLLSDADWKKWWTRARTALKKCRNMRVTGRSPYELEYVDEPIALDGEMLEAFGRLHDPVEQLGLIEKYIRECRARKDRPSEDALQQCLDSLTQRARRVTRQGAVQSGLFWAVAKRVSQLSGIDENLDEVIDLFSTSPDLKAIFRQIESDVLLDVATTFLMEARPDDWPDHLAALLPTLPSGACDRAAARLIEAGRGAADFEPVVQQVMSSSVEHFEALLWLWDGPSDVRQIPVLPPLTLLSRILRTLEECRRSDKVPRETTRKLAGRARAVLSARKYERFDRLLNELDPDMVGPLRQQIRRLDSLGRAVREDLVKRLDRRFPPVSSEGRIQPWALEDVLYVTEEGLARKQGEIEHHVNVKMKENAKAIGRAAALGDLSENSEYKFALEERDLLRARLAQMNEEVAKARVFTPADVPTEHVGIGTKVTFRRTTDGQSYEMSFVGPWEADGDKARFNYRAPIARKVLGKQIGDVVELDHGDTEGSYEIVALTNALAESE
jgi:transcription elongation GreA/GreB family factor